MSDNSLSNSENENNSNHGSAAGNRFPLWVEHTFNWVLATILFAELFILFGNVILRQVFNKSFDGAGEVASLTLMSLAFIGGAVAYYKGEQIAVHFLVEKFSPKWKAFTGAFTTWLIIAMSVEAFTLNFPVITHNWAFKSPLLELPNGLVYVPFGVGMALMVIIAVKRLTQYSLRTAATSFVVVAGLFAIWYYAQSLTGPWNGAGGFLFVLILLFATIAIGVPIGFVLPVMTYLYMVSSQAARAGAIPVAMTNGISGFIMLAIPFFILAGFIMTEGGLSKILADWLIALIGQVRGGLLHVLVVGMFIFSGISGSKVADVAAVGTTMKNMLKNAGYKPAESTSVLGASAIMGETIPPSLPLMVLASVSTLSVGGLFAAGIIPALFMAICLMIFISIRARVNKWPKGASVPWIDRFKATLRALPVLAVPIMLVVGIAGGIATPTEVSSFAVVYAVVISTVFYKSVRLRDLVKIFADAGVSGGMILFIISAGSAFSQALTIANVPHAIVSLLNAVGGTSTVFLIFSLVVLVIMGGVLEGLPALLIFGPMLMPIAAQFGLNGYHYGIVLIFAMGMGAFLPPFGIGFFVSCSIGGSTMNEVIPKYIPYLLVLIVGLLMVTFFPWFSVVLPTALHLIK